MRLRRLHGHRDDVRVQVDVLLPGLPCGQPGQEEAAAVLPGWRRLRRQVHVRLRTAVPTRFECAHHHPSDGDRHGNNESHTGRQRLQRLQHRVPAVLHGDLFVGNKYLEPYESVYNQALGNKQCLGQNQGMYMNGYNNTMAVLKWALENYPNPEQIVVGGYSAGSLGAQMWSAYVAKTWEVESKSTKFQVLADSYVGVFPEYKVAASQLINYYGGCGLLGFPDSMTAECEAETATAVEMVSSLMKEASGAEWLFIDSIADKTQRKFYELVLLGIAGYPFTNLLPADEFYGNMTEILDAYSEFMNITRFNIDSDQHVWLTGNNYENAEDLEGQLLGDVLNAWLSDSTSSSSGSVGSSTSSSGSKASSSSGSGNQTTAPTETPVSTTASPTETPVSSSSSSSSSSKASSSSNHTTAPTSSSSSWKASSGSNNGSQAATPTETPAGASATPTPTPATTEPTVDIPTYC
ncbi:hypothetical protein DVH05_016902 [Phytophthora capsici]|nr:hypothetical protein DVH05_016902 [Phytophthora capsici]